MADTHPFPAPTRPPSGISFPTETSIRFYANGRYTTKAFTRQQIDAEIARIQDMDPSVDDTPSAAGALARRALTQLAMKQLGFSDDPDALPAASDAANALILYERGSLVRIKSERLVGTVISTQVDVGVRTYTIRNSDWGTIPDLLAKDLERVRDEELDG
jgi:hypothetical protein